MSFNIEKNTWQDKIVNTHVLGGIETAVCDNGIAKGTRIAWINTGTGLRYKIVLDRSMDIVDTFYNQYCLSWLSHTGVAAPRPDANHDLEWLYSFSGGLMTTCGLTHIGAPEVNDSEEHGLHGRISNIPAEIESIIQPDPNNGRMEMSITGVVKQSCVFGPLYELRRTISSTLLKPVIKIKDTVTNKANTRSPLMFLYHCNFGWPLIDKGTEIVWKGECVSRGTEKDNEIFNGEKNYKICPEPLKSHTGSKSALGFIDVTADNTGECEVGIYNPTLNISLMMRYQKKQLPCLTNWQHWGYGEYVTALELGTNPPTGQNQAQQNNKLLFLNPGESRICELEFKLIDYDKN